MLSDQGRQVTSSCEIASETSGSLLKKIKNKSSGEQGKECIRIHPLGSPFVFTLQVL